VWCGGGGVWVGVGGGGGMGGWGGGMWIRLGELVVEYYPWSG